MKRKQVPITYPQAKKIKGIALELPLEVLQKLLDFGEEVKTKEDIERRFKLQRHRGNPPS
jgi:hypothetical protein